MNDRGVTESVVEQATLAWLESLGWQVTHGLEIAPGEARTERADYAQVVLEARLNPALPAEALEDAFRKLTRSEGAELVARNRALHRLLVDGVTVEYRSAEGDIRGAQARVIDFDDPANNDWLAVNQFSVMEGKHSRRPDVVLFINGQPLAVVELKNAADKGRDHLDGLPAAPDLQGGDPWTTMAVYHIQCHLPNIFFLKPIARP